MPELALIYKISKILYIFITVVLVSKGALCEMDLSICDEVICQNNGTCTYQNTGNGSGVGCICQPGFTGAQCEMDISICNSTASNVCLNGGVCIDGVGDKFYCQCLPGWTGVSCELDVNECDSQPCQNGGICINQVNDFSCACPFGFTGRACETKLKICEENPCKNDAFCLEEGTKKTCYCVPDFHGTLCEEQYNECDPPPKCFNGGSCIDGVGAFSCSCPPGFFGDTCQCTAESTDLVCRQNNSSEYSSVMITPTALTSIFWLPEISLTTKVGPPQFNVSSEYDSALHSPYDPGGSKTTIISTSKVIEPTKSLVISDNTGASFSPELGTPTVLITTDLVSLTSTMHGLVSTTILLSPSESETTYDPCPTLEVPDISTPLLLSPHPSLSEAFLTKSMPTSMPSTMETAMPPKSSASDELQLSDGIISGTIKPPVSITQTPAVTRTEMTPTGIFSMEQSPTGLESVSSSPALWETPGIPVTPTSIIAITTPPAPGADNSSVYVVESTLFHSDPLFTTTLTPGASISVVDGSLWTSILIAPSPSEDYTSASKGYRTEDLSIGPTFDVQPTPIIPTVSSTKSVPNTLETLSPTPSLTIPEPTLFIPTEKPPNASDPCHNYCQNNATCVFHSIEPHCICPLKFTGIRCEIQRERIHSPSFAGDSFLEYKLPSEESSHGVEITTQMATVAPDGILLYSAVGKVYALIFIQSGLISLHFSCGTQSMHFVEMRTRVDNGFNFTMKFRMDLIIHDKDEVRCIGEVSVNQSYVMKGEQVVKRNSHFWNQPIETFQLGGVGPSKVESNDAMITALPGFRGCMYSLQINHLDKDMYEDAMDGRNIAECTALGCAVNPCASASTCVPSNIFPFWECICPMGFQGTRCQMRVCSINPCMNGATCAIDHNTQMKQRNLTELSTYASLDDSGEIQNGMTVCLCPLGYTGDVCQTSINITKPSFQPVSDYDYSSYISYEPIPRYEDWMQLKFHFVTMNMSQISLLLYTGNHKSVSNVTPAQLENPISANNISHYNDVHPAEGEFTPERVSDFFAISFLKGFIALTWNLGSGTQRITTPSRIDSRLNVHTLFAGRSGRIAWLKVDGMRNTSGSTPGPLYRLNVISNLYIGGYEAFRFEGLPHDLPLHTGFQGCVFDFGYRDKNMLRFPKQVHGRHVKNCFEEDC